MQTRRNLSDFILKKDIDEGGFDTPGTRSLYGIYAITKSIVGVTI